MAKRGPCWLRRLPRFRRKKPDKATTSEPDASASLPPEVPWAAGASDPGKVRESNEDTFLCDLERRLFVIADGMGGHAGGDLASQTAVTALSEFLTPERIAQALAGSDGDAEGLLGESLEQANQRILSLARESQECKGMGSTAVIVLVGDSKLHVANLGDSRVYLVRSEKTRLLTRDHSVAAILHEQGQLAAEEARSHGMRNLLTALLGLERPVVPAYAAVPLEVGDRVLLCSDGLWDMLPDSEIGRLTHLAAEPREAVETLVRAANQAGGLDNITAIAVFITPPPVAEAASESLAAPLARGDQAEVTAPAKESPGSRLPRLRPREG